MFDMLFAVSEFVTDIRSDITKTYESRLYTITETNSSLHTKVFGLDFGDFFGLILRLCTDFEPPLFSVNG